MQEENLLEVTLSDGWYSGRLGYTKKSHVYGDVMALYCKLRLTYEDGSTEILESDETWRAGGSNILTSSLFDGEKVDFRLKDGEVNSLPFAKKYDFEIPFEPYDYEPTRKIDALCPTVLWTDGKTTRLDFKQNFAGFISFTAKGKAGTKITLRHAEVLNDDGTLYYENLRSVQATDEVILSDDEVVFAPKVTDWENVEVSDVPMI
jgi:alpha-L-rhamnosidase